MTDIAERVFDGERFPIPKTIANHPGIEQVTHGADEGGDYKWFTYLKAGWVYENGRMAGCRSGNFNSVTDFRHANPVRVHA